MNWLDSVYSDGSRYFISNPLPKKKEKIYIYLRVRHNCELKHVILRTKLNGIEILKTMEIEREMNGLDYYKTDITVFEDVIHYHFYLVTNNKIYYYNQLEITDYIPNEYYDFKILCDYKQPQWVKESVFYQIFPDRFFNGNKENDVKTKEYSFDGHFTIQIKDWKQTPLTYNKGFCLDFYGGDLQGIEKKIPYLKELGVNALYLNPIFYAATVHKYDCLDYFEIDPHFGGNRALSSLTKRLHENNMRLILDVSINHTGISHKWFNMNGEFFDKSIGAYNNPDSLERKYYFFNDDNTYRSWLGVRTLPTLNYSSQELRKIIYKNRNSFLRKWLSKPYNIDGWRFDVADIFARNNELQLHHIVWPEIRDVIKKTNEDAYLLAEDWSDCDEFLKGNEWDSSMNYFGFTRPVREFVGEVDLFNRRNDILNFKIKLTASNLIHRFKAHLSKLPFVIQENQFNLLDSHDVPRLHNNEKVLWEEYKGAVYMLFTMIGTPSVYYGDEAKIDGIITTNEGCRYPFPWDSDFKETKQYNLYRQLASLKRNESALKYGGLKFLAVDNNYSYTLGYARFTLDEVIFVIVSTDEMESRIKINLFDFGKEQYLPEEDLFGEKIDYCIIDDYIELIIKPHKAYIFKV